MKTDLFAEFEEILEMDTKEDLLKYIFDQFSYSELVDLLNHIREEKQW